MKKRSCKKIRRKEGNSLCCEENKKEKNGCKKNHYAHKHDSQHEEHRNEHHHEHSHELQGCEIELSEHEQFKIASYKFTLKRNSKEEAEQACESFISSLGSGIQAAGGVIGHIKAIAGISEGGYMYSLTYDDKVSKFPIEGLEVRIEGVAIAAAVKDAVMRKIIKDAYEKVSSHEDVN